MTGFVYAIGDSERVKIGWSADPIRRLVKIKSDCSTDTQLLGLVPATRAQEAEAHQLLAYWRIQGEWFRHEGAVAAFVAMLPRPKPKPVKSINIPEDAHPLRRWRLEQGLSLKSASKFFSVSHPSLCRWENGVENIAVSRLKLIVQVTGIPAAKLRPDIAAMLKRPEVAS